MTTIEILLVLIIVVLLRKYILVAVFVAAGVFVLVISLLAKLWSSLRGE
jgi:hypothetical protein